MKGNSCTRSISNLSVPSLQSPCSERLTGEAAQTILYQSDHLFKQITLAREASLTFLYRYGRRSISDRAMPIGKAKHRFWDRAPRSAQRAEGDRHRRTALRRLRSRSGGLWGFLRGCKGGDSEPLPRPLKALLPFVKGISCTRNISAFSALI